MLNVEVFKHSTLKDFRPKCIEWLKQYDTFCLLDSHAEVNINHHHGYRDYDFVVAAGVKSVFISENHTLSELDKIYKQQDKWLFGFFSYDLKNQIEDLDSKNPDYLNWPDFYFFQPAVLILVRNNEITIQAFDKAPTKLFLEIEHIRITHMLPEEAANIQARMSKPEYLNGVQNLRRHILRGDIYEVNFCQEFFAYTSFDPFRSYNELNTISPTPFSCFFRLNDKFLLSASPERYIKKVDQSIISQPIKGTAKRGENNSADGIVKKQLKNDPKERAENVMIVDLVRNDLSKIAESASVKVDELCGIYSFSHVHQMISTVSAKLKTASIEKIIKATFPMGSMTGAPKIRAMELAEQYETTKRGLYSGAVGYINPGGDFDFSVVIRSLQYNQLRKYLSYMVGGAITWLSDPEKEYEECLLKAKAIEELLRK